MFGELNKSFVSIDWEVNTEGYEYVKCSDQDLDTIIPIKGLFTTPDNGYGVGAVAIIEGALLNLPARYVEVVQSIINTPEMVDAIKAGKCGIKITTFDSKKFKRKGYDIAFLDI